jgi:hypothetical protein
VKFRGAGLNKLYLSTLIILCAGCGSVNDLHGYQPYNVEKINEHEYYIIFHGTEFTTLPEAQEAWDHRANGTCQGSYQYFTVKQFKDFKEGKLETVVECPKGKNLNCIKTKKDYGDSLTKKHIDAVGIAMCGSR